MEAGLSQLMQQLRHNAMSIQQTLVDEKKSGVSIQTNYNLSCCYCNKGIDRNVGKAGPVKDD